MWIKLDESKSVDNVIAEYQMNESAMELRDNLIDDGLPFNESNKMIEKLKGYLSKYCPGPDSIKQFFSGIGQKIDAKIQNCKYDILKNAWNTLKNAVNGTSEEGGGEEEVAESRWYSIYNEADDGLVDAEQPQQAATKKKVATKRPTAKKPVAKKPVAKKQIATKKPVAKKKTAKRTATKKSGGNAKPNAKQQGNFQKVMEFVKKNWKVISIVLMVSLAFVFPMGAMVLKLAMASASVKNACKTVSSAPGLKPGLHWHSEN